MEYIYHIIKRVPLLAVCLALGLSSCDKNDEPAPGRDDEGMPHREKVQKTVLVYTVAANDIEDYLKRDSVEMSQAAPYIEGLGRDVNVVLYFAGLNRNATLSELRLDPNGHGYFKCVKSYDRDISSVDPLRVREVLSDVMSSWPADRYGTVMGSHASGWTPDFYHTGCDDDTPEGYASRSWLALRGVGSPQDNLPSAGRFYSFGRDLTTGCSDTVDLDALATCFDDGSMDFIWFDACYMGGIEVAYQFRDKCRLFAGSAAEVGASGLDYTATLPLLARRDSDVTGAARSYAEAYGSSGTPYTICVVDETKLDKVAETVRPLVSTDDVYFTSLLQSYHRFPFGPFYDLRQYVRASAQMLNTSAVEDLQAFEASYADAIKYKSISPRSFSNTEWSEEDFGGLSAHVYGTAKSSAQENYFLNLDWGRDVYGR